MRDKTVNTIVKRARKDTTFFHALIFDPESVIADLDYLDRDDKARLIALNPGDFIGDLIGWRVQDCSVTVNCGDTCSHTQPCTCDVTVDCTSTCSYTSDRNFAGLIRYGKALHRHTQ